MNQKERKELVKELINKRTSEFPKGRLSDHLLT